MHDSIKRGRASFELLSSSEFPESRLPNGFSAQFFEAARPGAGQVPRIRFPRGAARSGLRAETCHKPLALVGRQQGPVRVEAHTDPAHGRVLVHGKRSGASSGSPSPCNVTYSRYSSSSDVLEGVEAHGSLTLARLWPVAYEAHPADEVASARDFDLELRGSEGVAAFTPPRAPRRAPRARQERFRPGSKACRDRGGARGDRRAARSRGPDGAGRLRAHPSAPETSARK